MARSTISDTQPVAMGAFHAYRNAAGLSLASGGVVPFETEVYDINGWYNTATFQYIPQLAGIYWFSWLFTSGTAIGAGGYIESYLYKNGALNIRGPRSSDVGSNGPIVGGSAIALANGTTDAFTIVYVSSTTPQVVAAGALYNTYFQGYYLGRNT